jgi:N-formylglutamate amidohydrolase
MMRSGFELDLMTDHHTLEMFAGSGGPDEQIVRAEVSRLVVDVERFEDDRQEQMAARGMGAIYTVTSQLAPLRRPLSQDERADLIAKYYVRHHAKLKHAVAGAMDRHGRCLVIDCHSFPDVALPYESWDSSRGRPDICIGTEDFHTSDALGDAFVRSFAEAGWTVDVNSPFAGALVPMDLYRRDRGVTAVMVEVNRGLYLDGQTSARRADFAATAARVRRCCARAVEGIPRPSS